MLALSHHIAEKMYATTDKPALSQNLIYPSEAIINEKEGLVAVQFIIE